MTNVKACVSMQSGIKVTTLSRGPNLNVNSPFSGKFHAFIALSLFTCALLSCIISVSNCFVISVPGHASLPPSAERPSFTSLSPLARLKRHAPHGSSSGASQLSLNPWSEARLPINVRNNGGETFKEVISTNTEQDYIRIEFQETDGSLVKQLIDFKNNIQIFRLVRLGEQDLNEQKWQTYCFITRLPDGEYISADAMSKLTQKNPATIRQAEINHGSVLYDMDLEIQMDQSMDILSPHLNNFCEQAQKRIYASEEDLSKWTVTENGNRSFQNLSSLVHKLTTVKSDSTSSNQAQSNVTALSQTRKCGELLQNIYQNFTNRQLENHDDETPNFYNHRSHEALNEFLQTFKGQLCHCSLALVVPFFPCSVKHCTTKDPNNPDKLVSYRCGIKTCRKRYEFRFTVADKLFCLADFDPTITDSMDVMVNESPENVDSGSQQDSENA